MRCVMVLSHRRPAARCSDACCAAGASVRRCRGPGVHGARSAIDDPTRRAGSP